MANPSSSMITMLLSTVFVIMCLHPKQVLGLIDDELSSSNSHFRDGNYDGVDKEELRVPVFTKESLNGEEKRLQYVSRPAISVISSGCPDGERKDPTGRCRIVLTKNVAQKKSRADSRSPVGVIPSGCPTGQRKDPNGHCKTVIRQDPVFTTSSPNGGQKRPTVCPSGQRKDPNGHCKTVIRQDPVFTTSSPNGGQKRPTVCPSGQRKDPNGHCKTVI